MESAPILTTPSTSLSLILFLKTQNASCYSIISHDILCILIMHMTYLALSYFVSKT